MRPVETSITWIVAPGLSPECGVGSRTNAMDEPSGDQVSGDAGDPGGWLTGRLHEPDVRRRGSPPSALTSQAWVGSACDWIRNSSSPTSNESLNRSGPVFFSASSSVAYANVRPSGDQENCCTPLGALVTRFASPPPMRSEERRVG